MLKLALDEISPAYLQGICDDKTIESQTLEFKLELPPLAKRHEIQKDICASANAEGGDLVFGVAEVRGAASKLIPLSADALDAARRRIAQALDFIEPRLREPQVWPVSVPGGFVVIVRVPASFDGPHSYRVDSDARKFVIRNGTGTTDMNFDQIRTAFDRTATLAERAESFIGERFDDLGHRRTWRPFAPGPIAAVALVPIAGLAGRTVINIAALNDDYFQFTFPDWGSASRAMNLDGLVAYQAVKVGDPTGAYTQVYRSGSIISLRTAASAAFQRQIIPSTVVTRFYRDAVIKMVASTRGFGINGPAVLRCALINVGPYQFGVGHDAWRQSVAVADRNSLLLPNVWIPALEQLDTSDEIDKVVRPMMDVLWQSFDVDRCLEYDENGRWAPR